MVGRRGVKRSTAVVPLCAVIALAVGLAGCASGPGAVPAPTVTVTAVGGGSAVDVAEVHGSGTGPDAGGPGRLSGSEPLRGAGGALPPTGAPATPTDAVSSNTAPGNTGPGSASGPAPAPPSPVPDPSPAPGPVPVPAASADTTVSDGAAPSGSGGIPPEDQLLGSGPAIYLVAIDDGGSRGARFGCNDSLVAVAGPAPDAGGGQDSGTPSGAGTPDAGAGSDGQESGAPPTAPPTRQDPLEVAMTRLLRPDSVPAGSGLHNALSASNLTFASGTTDGATVTVDLRGELRQGGVCDIPRIEAQLTQTAIAAAGAVRAEIRIGGRPLAELLELR